MQNRINKLPFLIQWTTEYNIIVSRRSEPVGAGLAYSL